MGKKQQLVNFPVTKRTRLASKRHCEVVDENQPSPVKKFKQNVTPLSPLLSSNVRVTTPVKVTPVKETMCVKALQFDDVTQKEEPKKPDSAEECFQKAKQALQVAQSATVVGRETEVDIIRAFVTRGITSRTSASLYISGAPGTGKTAVISNLMAELKADKRCSLMHVNCATLSGAQAIYEHLVHQLPKRKQTTFSSNQQLIENVLCSSGPMIVLVLDEIDQLDSRHQSILYTMFEWPNLPASRLILIGIANALDLTDRILPRLEAKGCRPQLLDFKPYNQHQLAAIINSRLAEVCGETVVDASAVQLCARKVAAGSGDVRKALNVCRRAVELVHSAQRKQAGSEVTPRRVTAPLISCLLTDVYSSPKTTVLPLQQKLCLCTLLLMMKRDGRGKGVLLGKMHDTYVKVCKKLGVSPTDQSEFVSLLSFITLIEVTKAKDTRMSMVRLKADDSEVEAALADTTLMSTVLNMTI